MRVDYSGAFQYEKEKQNLKTIKLIERLVLALFVIVLILAFYFTPSTRYVADQKPVPAAHLTQNTIFVNPFTTTRATLTNNPARDIANECCVVRIVKSLGELL